MIYPHALEIYQVSPLKVLGISPCLIKPTSGQQISLDGRGSTPGFSSVPWRARWLVNAPISILDILQSAAPLNPGQNSEQRNYDFWPVVNDGNNPFQRILLGSYGNAGEHFLVTEFNSYVHHCRFNLDLITSVPSGYGDPITFPGTFPPVVLEYYADDTIEIYTLEGGLFRFDGNPPFRPTEIRIWVAFRYPIDYYRARQGFGGYFKANGGGVEIKGKIVNLIDAYAAYGNVQFDLSNIAIESTGNLAPNILNGSLVRIEFKDTPFE